MPGLDIPTSGNPDKKTTVGTTDTIIQLEKMRGPRVESSRQNLLNCESKVRRRHNSQINLCRSK